MIIIGFADSQFTRPSRQPIGALQSGPDQKAGFVDYQPDPVDQPSDPVDQVTAIWTIKTGLKRGLVGKRSRRLWMLEGLMLLQLDPLDHPFDPEDQAPTLWISAN